MKPLQVALIRGGGGRSGYWSRTAPRSMSRTATGALRCMWPRWRDRPKSSRQCWRPVHVRRPSGRSGWLDASAPGGERWPHGDRRHPPSPRRRRGRPGSFSTLSAESRTPGRPNATTYAARKGHVPVAELLLAKGAVVDDTDEAGFTPLHAAAVAGQEGAVRVLLAQGASVWTREIH
jgi:ankyrin repeat protein